MPGVVVVMVVVVVDICPFRRLIRFVTDYDRYCSPRFLPETTIIMLVVNRVKLLRHPLLTAGLAAASRNALLLVEAVLTLNDLLPRVVVDLLPPVVVVVVVKLLVILMRMRMVPNIIGDEYPVVVQLSVRVIDVSSHRNDSYLKNYKLNS